MFPWTKFLHILFCTPSGQLVYGLKISSSYLPYFGFLWFWTDRPTDRRTTGNIEDLVDPKNISIFVIRIYVWICVQIANWLILFGTLGHQFVWYACYLIHINKARKFHWALGLYFQDMANNLLFPISHCKNYI